MVSTERNSMARRRNPETIMKILDASWNLFGKKGYTDTSYADVARASGINRATVQHYFPKKELMASQNLVRLRGCAVERAGKEFPDAQEPFARLYLLGQIYIAALMSCAASRRFISGVLENRLLTDETINSDFEWSLEYVFDAAMREAGEGLRQDIVVAMGGLYELMFQCILRDAKMDISQRLRPVFRSFAELVPLDAQACERVLDSYAIDESRLVKLGLEVFEAVPKLLVVDLA